MPKVPEGIVTMRSGALPWVVALLLTLLAWQWYDAGVARSRARV